MSLNLSTSNSRPPSRWRQRTSLPSHHQGCFLSWSLCLQVGHGFGFGWPLAIGHKSTLVSMRTFFVPTWDLETLLLGCFPWHTGDMRSSIRKSRNPSAYGCGQLPWGPGQETHDAPRWLKNIPAFSLLRLISPRETVPLTTPHPFFWLLLCPQSSTPPSGVSNIFTTEELPRIAFLFFFSFF